MKVIEAKTIAEAWLGGSSYLRGLPDWADLTVLLHVSEPTLVRKQDREVANILDSFLRDHGAFSNHTVAETIFPGYEYRHRGVQGVYENYPDTIYPKLKEHPAHRWGTYAYRLLRRQSAGGEMYNPLKDCIKKMCDKTRKSSVYEINLYDDMTDRHHRMGGPCLSHISFKAERGGRLHLTAVYRLHYYVQRAYGNLLGLARLQTFVADQAGLTVGSLVCHSTRAELEVGRHGQAKWTKREVDSLIGRGLEISGTADARDKSGPANIPTTSA